MCSRRCAHVQQNSTGCITGLTRNGLPTCQFSSNWQLFGVKSAPETPIRRPAKGGCRLPSTQQLVFTTRDPALSLLLPFGASLIISTNPVPSSNGQLKLQPEKSPISSLTPYLPPLCFACACIWCSAAAAAAQAKVPLDGHAQPLATHHRTPVHRAACQQMVLEALGQQQEEQGRCRCCSTSMTWRNRVTARARSCA